MLRTMPEPKIRSSEATLSESEVVPRNNVVSKRKKGKEMADPYGHVHQARKCR